MTFASEVAVITGAGSGIGRALTAAVLREGGSVLAIDRRWDEDPPPDPKDGELQRVTADVRDREALEAVRDRLDRDPTVLVNSAGIAGPEDAFDGTNLDAWRETLDVNLWGAVVCTHVFLPRLIDGRSTILNVVSHGGLYGVRHASAYASAKGGLIAFTLSLASELVDRGITVNGFLPGPTATAMPLSRRTPEELDALVDQGVMATADEVAESALAVISPDWRRVSGQIIGGRPFTPLSRDLGSE
ncbi:MAG: SDR family oxidoreductase [Acidimicrobiia bacterium]